LTPDSPLVGGGRGLWSYYRDNGIVPPEELARIIPKMEITGTDMERETYDD
jgi:hypothetical protein